MSNLEQAAREALNILDTGVIPKPGWVPDYQDAKAALSRALDAGQAQAVTECADNDSPWLVCKVCALNRRCAKSVQPLAWLCELAQEDGSVRRMIVEEDPDGLRFNDIGEPSPFRVTPLYAAPPAQAVQWQPIEMAPRDAPILVCCKHGMYVAEWREHDIEYWHVDDNKHGPFPLRGAAPTHWMPLPPAPTEGEPR